MAIYTTTPHPFPYYEGRFGSSYRIEHDLTQPLRPMQRHVWIYDDGKEEPEDWILSIRTTEAALIAKGFTLVSKAA